MRSVDGRSHGTRRMISFHTKSMKSVDGLEFPSEWSTQQLPGTRKSTRKKPSAWAEFHEEEDRPSHTERWAPHQLGGGHGNRQDSQGTLCKFRLPTVPDFASLTGTRR
jgi:hypothetical protein